MLEGNEARPDVPLNCVACAEGTNPGVTPGTNPGVTRAVAAPGICVHHGHIDPTPPPDPSPGMWTKLELVHRTDEWFADSLLPEGLLSRGSALFTSTYGSKQDR